MRIFLDANILFSASHAGSATARLIQRLLERAEAATCEYAIEEARRNIELKRPGWAGEFAGLMPKIITVSTLVFALSVKLAEKDVPILCSAVRAGCEYLVTSDKQDFGHLYNQTGSSAHSW
jgi:hypothetical protein